MDMIINPLSSGTVVKIYNSNRGQDYVIVGISKDKNKLVMVKNSTVTNDGRFFKQTKLYLSDIVPMFRETDPFYFAPQIKRVVGHRALNDITTEELKALVNATPIFYPGDNKVSVSSTLESFSELKVRDEVYPHVNVPDIKKVISY